jgi:hypothetical protein
MRKIVHFQVHEGFVHALCRDGTLWVIRLNEPDAEWCPTPEIPDIDGELEENKLINWKSFGIENSLFEVSSDGRHASVVDGLFEARMLERIGHTLVDCATADDARRIHANQHIATHEIITRKIRMGGHVITYLVHEISPF